MSAHAQIVVGVDGSPGSRAALRWAADQAGRTGAELRAVSAWQEPPVGYPLGGLGPRAPFDPHATAQQALEGILAEVLGAETSARTGREVLEGHPAKVLIDVSKEADLLVVGTRGHGGFAGLLLGSVGQHVAAHAVCTVVVVREK